MMHDHDWYRLHLLSSYHDKQTDTIDMEASTLFWNQMQTIGKQNITYSEVSQCFLRDGVLLHFFYQQWDRLTPVLKILVKQAVSIMKKHQRDYRRWDPILEKQRKVGTEYLIQFPAFAGTMHFSSAFWRPGWEKPMLFTFLVRVRDCTIVKKEHPPFVDTHVVPYLSYAEEQDQKRIRRRQPKKRYSISQQRKKSMKSRRKAQKTRFSNKTLGQRFFPKQFFLEKEGGEHDNYVWCRWCFFYFLPHHSYPVDDDDEDFVHDYDYDDFSYYGYHYDSEEDDYSYFID